MYSTLYILRHLTTTCDASSHSRHATFTCTIGHASSYANSRTNSYGNGSSPLAPNGGANRSPSAAPSAIGGACFILAGCSSEPTLKSYFRNRILVFTRANAYPMYLGHWTAVLVFRCACEFYSATTPVAGVFKTVALDSAVGIAGIEAVTLSERCTHHGACML